MKALTLIIIAQFIALTAQAVHIPSWDRPVAEANEITVLENSGVFKDVQNLSLRKMRNDGTGKEKVEMIIDETRIVFALGSKDIDGCNSAQYFSTKTFGYVGEVLNLYFTDHSSRFCKDIQPYEWVMTLESIDNKSLEILGTLKLGVNPVAVYTIQTQPPHNDFGSATTFAEDEDADLTVIRITK
ncbi:MAG: hypothetical protein KDD58_13755 [Bdellovibrionales bacterium]|nr:hypothetical protein [Bdellovibrionales bacterium]